MKTKVGGTVAGVKEDVGLEVAVCVIEGVEIIAGSEVGVLLGLNTGVKWKFAVGEGSIVFITGKMEGVMVEGKGPCFLELKKTNPTTPINREIIRISV